MSELISRQKLIEAIEREFDGVCTYDVSPSQAVSDFIEIVDRQPPADQWIPCSERLPNDMKKVLVTLVSTTGKQYVRTDHIMHGRWWQFEDEYVKAWMPLPEPYKED